ncbi:MAG: MarR family winged helix-turn-helix transcriptional regulator [Solirubrobacterales bacterium]
MAPATKKSLTDADYAHLADLRSGIRTYLAWAEQRAKEHDLTPAQVQLALAIRSHDDPAGPTIGELAETLLLRHHSAVGLVDRAVENGMVRRVRDSEKASRVHVVLTEEGAERLEILSRLHLEWLAEHAGEMARVWRSFKR